MAKTMPVTELNALLENSFQTFLIPAYTKKNNIQWIKPVKKKKRNTHFISGPVYTDRTEKFYEVYSPHKNIFPGQISQNNTYIYCWIH